MRNYIKLYPEAGDDETLRIAMADQIEQRILPKLRGIDMMDEAAQQAVQSVHKLVDKELKDEVLSDAIDTGSKGHHFAWQGIDRSAE